MDIEDSCTKEIFIVESCNYHFANTNTNPRFFHISSTHIIITLDKCDNTNNSNIRSPLTRLKFIPN